MLVLVLAALNLRPGITSFAPLIEHIAEQLQLSRGMMSLSTALPVFCMGLLAPLAPVLAQRFGLERTIALCMGLIGLALLLRLVPGSGLVLIGTAALLGTGIAIAGPLLSGFIKRHFFQRMGWVVAWYSLSMAVGGACGVILTVPLSGSGESGWRIGLAFWALPALLAMLCWLCVPNHRETEDPAAGSGMPWRQPRAWLVSSFFALQAGLFYAMATWIVARYQEAGLDLLYSNSLFSIAMLVGIPSSFGLPWLAQRLDNRYTLLIGCGVAATLALSLITFAPAWNPEIAVTLIGIGLGGSFSLALVLPLYEAESPLAVSRWTAMMLCAGYCMACLTPVLSGLARDLAGNYQVPFMALSALAVLMTFLAWALGNGRPQRPHG